MAQLKDLLVSGPSRLLNNLYVSESIQVSTGIKIGSANELKSFGTGLSINSSGVLSCTVAGTITGSGTSGYLTKWNGGSSITNGPQLGSGTTTYLRNDGSWATPANTTYTLGTGTTTVTLTPSSGNQQSITVPYATSAGKATNDASSRAIETTYAHALTTNGNTIGLEHANGEAISGSFITVPYATTSGSLTGGTNGQVLISNGTKGVWTTPTWTTYTFASGKGTTNGFTVTPAGGSATTYSVGALLANEDKRSVATTPSTYYMTNGGLRFLGLKSNSTLGISNAGTYSAALGLSPWADTSGGDAFEFAFNTKGVWMRHGTSAWGSWATLLTSADLRISSIDIDGNTLTIYDQNGDDRQYSPSFSAGVGLSRSSTTFSLDTMFGAEFIVGTQTAATGSWTGVTKRTALYDGMQIAYWLPYAGSGNATLNLTLAGGGTTGAVNCYYNGTSRLTTHYGAGNLVHLTYRSNVNIGGTNYTGWWSNANYDSNDYDSLREYYAQPRVDTNSDFDLYMYQLLLTTKSGTVVPYSNGHNAPTTYTKTMTTDAFDPFAPIYRWGVSWDRTEAKGAIIPAGYLYTAVQLADVRYYWNIESSGTAGTTSLTANQPIYIKAKYTRTTHTAVLVPISGSANYLERNSIVQTLPSSNPNGTLAATETYIYIFLGYAYDKYRMVLYEQKPIYWWDPTTNTMGRFTEKLGELAYVSPSTSGTATTLFLGYNSDTGVYSLMDPLSDHLVNQVNSNNNVAYRVLLSYSDSNSTQVNLTYKNSGLTFNPSTGILSSAKIETGSAATSYFQSQRFRGEGDAATYYHAVDFGYASHDRVDFYEYGGIFCFHKHTAAAVGSGDTVLGTITTNGWEGKLKLPNTSTPITGIGSGLAVTSSGSLYCTVTPCLIEGTKILMADGTEKNIEEVVRGDVIMSYDPNVNQTCEAIVLDCVDTGVSDDYINYFFDNGSMLTVYDKHCFYNKEIGTAKDVKKWELGDTGIDQYGQDAMFVGSEELHYAGRKHHYDLRSSNMLFFANGILNAESLTYNYWWHGDDDLPESFRKAMKADYDSSANLHKHQASRDYGMALAPIIKEIRKQEKIIADNKKLLSDSDYIVQKFTEGLIGAVEWAKAKVSRSGWRDLINTAETALTTAKSRMKTIKAKYATTETRRERFNAAVARDNACLEELKAYFKSKNELSK